MKRLSSLLLMFCLVSGVGAAEADPFATGDVFAAVVGGVQHYSAAGALLETLVTGGGGFNTGMAFDSSGNLYVTNFSASTVTQFTGPGDPHTGSSFGSGYHAPESIVFDNSGNVYVGSTGGGIQKLDAAGTPGPNIASGTQFDWIDLKADQKTMLFTQEGSRIGTIDVSTGLFGSDFASGIAGNAFALRILSDGGVLLADGVDIKRFNSAGMQIQTYDLPGHDSWFALNLDPDGVSFWSGDFNDATLQKFNIGDGVNTQTIATGVGPSSLFGVAVSGEIVAGCTTCGGEAVPEPATVVLLGSGLAAGFWARRRMK